MKRYILFTLLIVSLLSNNIEAQVFANKLNIYLSGGLNKTIGNTEINDNNFITPALLNNYKTGTNYNLKGTYKLYPFFSVGMQLKQTNFTEWENSKDSTLYKNSNSKITTFAPVIKVQTPYKESGFFNRFALYAELKPTLGNIKLELDKPINSIINSSGNEIEPILSSTDFIYGVGASVGVEMNISNRIGLFSDFSIDFHKVDAELFNEKKFLYTSINLGVIIKLFTEKSFYY